MSFCLSIFLSCLFYQGCVCDARYNGFDCSRKVCPDGDDPLTRNQINEIQLVHIYIFHNLNHINLGYNIIVVFKKKKKKKIKMLYLKSF